MEKFKGWLAVICGLGNAWYDVWADISLFSFLSRFTLDSGGGAGGIKLCDDGARE